jgi:hypothetical protein
MRMLATLAVIAASLSFSHEASAQGKYYPWCARYDAWSIVCGFDTFRQCMATVSGVGGICQENVMPPPLVEAGASHKRKHRQRH